MAQLDPNPYPIPEELKDMGGDWKAYMKAEDEFLGKLRNEGRLWMWGVADGSALYYVKRWTPLVLQHIPLGDAYQVPYAHIRGLRETEVSDMIDADRRLHAVLKPKV